MPRQPPQRANAWSMDEGGMRTLFVGLIVAFALYGLSFVAIPLIPGDRGRWISVGLVLVSILLLGIWFLAVRAGWRLFGAKTRNERRSEEKRKAEREKRIRLRAR